MKQLPIHPLLDKLQSTFNTHNQIILQAPTGAGKSTALPLAILEWPEIQGKIIMLEPRRVAARNVAQFIASKKGQQLGHEVGFRVKGESRISSHTRLEVVTEGILTRMIQQDPELTGISLVIFDEIHERHLTTDLALALALEVQSSLREDLKILAMSATLSGLPLQKLMPNAPLLESQGRCFPVTIDYRPAKPQQDWLIHMGQEILKLVQSLPNVIAESSQVGILAFLPGKGEILRLKNYLEQRLSTQHYNIFPLYGELNPKEQDAAIAAVTDGRAKIVLSTNVAESSVTIEGINIVVDSGYKRHASFNPKTGVSRLGLKRISQASATQRTGRAGRLASGYCVRLWGQEEHGRLPQTEVAEIHHADLLSITLDCANWGARELSELSLMEQPPQAHEEQAWNLLCSLELVDSDHKLTLLGKAAYALGCQPRQAYMLLKAETLGKALQDDNLLPLACMLAGILEARGLPRLGEDISQYLTLASKGMLAMQVNKWLRHFKVNHDLNSLAKRAHLKDIGLLLALAYPDRIAKNRAKTISSSNNARSEVGFQLANGTGVTLSAESSLAYQDFLVVADFQENDGQTAGRVYLATSFDINLLDEALKYLIQEKALCSLDEQTGRVTAVEQSCIGDIVLKQKPLQNIDTNIVKQTLLDVVMRKGLSVLDFNEQVQQLCIRVELARRYDPQYDWPDYSENYLGSSVANWLSPYMDNVSSLTQVRKLDCQAILFNALAWELQQRLKQLLPCCWLLPTGTQAPIRYSSDGRILMSLRLQEAFGMQDSPQLLNGKLKVTMELLSPARRPLALTSDLANFWAGSYIEVKKEMRGRYPKHIWPDDPVNTKPTKHTKKYNKE